MISSALWPDLADKNITLVVSGGIAAYKSAELCRLFTRCGAHVQVLLTDAGAKFVGETTFAALSGKRVVRHLFDPKQEHEIGHIALADQTDLFVVAPCTANLLAKMALGIGDTLASTVFLAYTGPTLIAPAMNVHMWESQAVQANVDTLEERGCVFVGPDAGEMACGHVGAGRMTEPDHILMAAGAALTRKSLAGKEILITAGPTQEALDPVRYLGNRSSGKMGFALAAEAAARGANVTLVSGPVHLEPPRGVNVVSVQTAQQMFEAVKQSISKMDIAIMAAAVADYRPVNAAATKIKKTDANFAPDVQLEQTVDILAWAGSQKKKPLLVGFAAETDEDLDTLAKQKMQKKNCDLLVANDVSKSDAGFNVDQNRVSIFSKKHDSKIDVPLASKREVAGSILDAVEND